MMPLEKPAKAPRRRVLIVDDNADAAMTYALLIRSMGHEVVTAQDGRAGERLARTFRPEVIFMDMVLPDVDGCDLAKQLIAELGSAVRIYIITAYVDDRAERRALEAGCEDYFVKPLDPKVLEKALA